MDLCKRFQSGQTFVTDDRIIVLSIDEVDVGILADSCSEVIILDKNKSTKPIV